MHRVPEAVVRSLPCWRGELTVEPLRGGLSNACFRVVDEAGAHVSRVGRDFPFHHVFRDHEAAVSRWAHAAGLAPKVHYSGQGVLVTAFIDGSTLEAADVRSRLDEVTDLLKHGHRGLRDRARGPARFFWVFHVIRDYADTLVAGRHEVVPHLSRLLQIASELEAAQIPQPVVFGHHDLLPANFLHDNQRLWLIDWEYAAFGAPMFDLANVAVNAEFTNGEESRLLEHYFERRPNDETLRAFAAMKVASALREALWAMVSELHLDAPGADYAAYGKICLAKFEAALAVYQERLELK